MILRILFAFLVSFSVFSAQAITCEEKPKKEIVVAVYSSNNGYLEFSFLHNLNEEGLVREVTTHSGVVTYSFYEGANKEMSLNAVHKTKKGKETKYNLNGKIVPGDARCPDQDLYVQWNDDRYNKWYVVIKP